MAVGLQANGREDAVRRAASVPPREIADQVLKKSSVYVALGPKLLIRDVRYSVAIGVIVLRNSAAFWRWVGFEC